MQIFKATHKTKKEKKTMNTKFFTTVLCLCLSLTATAQKRAFSVQDLYRVKSVFGIDLAPDGKDITFTQSEKNLEKFSSANYIYTLNLASGRMKAIQTNGKSYSSIWSADGKSIYYQSYASGLTQLCRHDLATGKDEQVTDFELGVTDPKVSPDGRYVAFVAQVYPEAGADGKRNAEMLKRKENGPIQAHLADRLLFRHWTEYDDGRYNHIIVLDTKNRTYTDVTPGRFHAPTFSPGGYEDAFAFSPDSKELCFSSNHDEHPEASTNTDLWTVSVEGGEARCITADNKAWDGSPLYSPDGRYIAYRKQTIPGYESDRFRLALYDRQTGETRTLTEKFDNWVDSYKWTADSKSICFLGQEKGYQPLFKLNLKSGRITKLIAGKAISEFCMSAAGQVFYTYSRTGKPTAIYTAGKKERQLTHFNDSLEQAVDIRPSEALWTRGADGDSVEYFMVKPHDFDPAKKYPVIINVHGGPQMQWMDSFRDDWQIYPGAGYIVVYPNPHGSTGYGQDFTRAISGNWGTKPYEDVMKVTDAVEQLPYVDKDRIGAMGWSYGGYFMNWLQANTRRYKCLASMMGLYDLPSMWGTTEELWFPNFDLNGQPWNSDLYKKFSPSQYTQNFATPTLIMTGERDYRVSYNQSLAYFTTLQTLGIPSRLIVLSNDGHWPGTWSMLVYYNAHLEWFHKYLGGAPAPWNTEKLVQNAEKIK